MPKRTEAEYTELLQGIPKLFHTLPQTEEQFWGGERDSLPSTRLAKNIGSVAMKAVGITNNLVQLAPIGLSAATSKTKEKLWQGVGTAAGKAQETGVEEAFWNAGPKAKEKLRGGINAATARLGSAAIGETLKGTAIAAANASGSVAPLAPVEYWPTVSKAGEKLKRGTNKAASYLGKAAIGTKARDKFNLESARNKATQKSTRHKKNFEKRSNSAHKRTENIQNIWSREVPYSLKGHDQYRERAEEYRRAATQAYESGRQEDFEKYMKKAKQQQDFFKKDKL